MDKIEFQKFLQEQIPITKEMGISILEFTPSKVRILAKLEPNKNHMNTAFGGSINTVMTLCGYAIAYANIIKVDSMAHIVVQRSNINYIAPIKEDFIAEATLTSEQERVKFLKSYEENQKGKIEIKVSCSNADTVFAEYEGKYVALK